MGSEMCIRDSTATTFAEGILLMSFKKGFTVKEPKKKKTKQEKTEASFKNPKAKYYKFVQPTGFSAMLKKKKKKTLIT